MPSNSFGVIRQPSHLERCTGDEPRLLNRLQTILEQATGFTGGIYKAHRRSAQPAAAGPRPAHAARRRLRRLARCRVTRRGAVRAAAAQDFAAARRHAQAACPKAAAAVPDSRQRRRERAWPERTTGPVVAALVGGAQQRRRPGRPPSRHPPTVRHAAPESAACGGSVSIRSTIRSRIPSSSVCSPICASSRCRWASAGSTASEECIAAW